MIWKRWELRATPIPESEAGLSQALADQFNAQPEAFWTRHGAAEAIYFYGVVCKMPVIFWVLDRKERPDGSAA